MVTFNLRGFYLKKKKKKKAPSSSNLQGLLKIQNQAGFVPKSRKMGSVLSADIFQIKMFFRRTLIPALPVERVQC